MPVQPPKSSNGFAVAALILGIVGLSVFGLVFGFIGLSRAKKVAKGKAMSIIAIVLSVLWLAGQVAGTAYVVSHVAKALDPGCQAAKAFILDDTKMKLDTSSVTGMKADLQTIITELKADAAKSTNSDARAAIGALAGDYQTLLDDLNSNTQPSDAFEADVQTHANAIDTACGTIGS